MSFLPIVDRELRVASRRWGTYLTRSGVGLLAIIIAIPVLFFGWLMTGGSGAGRKAFEVLAHYIFVVAFLGGVLVTADCLSSEKREGTLGLLFLTDLKGYDVVLGKFAALGLHSIYGLVAVFPVLALPLLTGGVTGSEFGRIALALLNLLFVSLSVGLAVSAVAREASRALSGTLLILLLLVVGLPLGMDLAGWIRVPEGMRLLTWLSPGHAFAVGGANASGAAIREFWISLGVSHGLAWVFLAAAGVLVPGSWQDREQRRDKPTLATRVFGTRMVRMFRSQRNAALLEQNPVLWLMGDRPGLKFLLWAITAVFCVCVLATSLWLKPRDAAGAVLAWSLIVLVIFTLALVEHTCRFWVESRQSGNLEALLAVPLESKQILASHWASIRRHFLWPLVVVLCLSTLPTWLTVIPELIGQKADGSRVFGSLFVYAYLGGFMLWFLANFMAIGYTGMWFSLKLRRPQFAPGLTLLCVVLLPMVLCWLGFGLTLIFIFLPMSLLQSNLRGMILQRYMPVEKGGRQG
ncbi:MAG: ABC transporter permease [Verrucomicrobia bacterium]|nr:ABC transporter permease [Verrucomicrobiota bacterium]